jgi:hypothetical protein
MAQAALLESKIDFQVANSELLTTKQTLEAAELEIT